MRLWGALLAWLPLFVAAAGNAQTSAAFDGAWAMTMTCGKSPGGAAPYTLTMPATVTAGHYFAERSKSGMPGYLRLDGTIQPDGYAVIAAAGLTGRPRFNDRGEAPSTPYQYTITARFDPSHGAGQRPDAPHCTVTFARP